MERTQSRDWENQCIQEQPPACTAACPLHVDARGMIAALARGDFAGAFALYARTIPFPRILSRICDEPCRRACKRNEVGEGILIRASEQACVTYCDKPPKKAPIPPRKSGRVAIVGGNLPGLTAAADLAHKGYPVTIFEAGDRLGGRLRDYSEEILPRTCLEQDLALLPELGVKICFHSPVADTGTITCDGLLAEYDAAIEPGAIIAIAGLSNGLGGALAANSCLPVISCPPFKDGVDMLLNLNSSLMMPSAVPNMTVVKPKEAALAALRALNLRRLKDRFRNEIVEMKNGLRYDDRNIREAAHA